MISAPVGLPIIVVRESQSQFFQLKIVIRIINQAANSHTYIQLTDWLTERLKWIRNTQLSFAALIQSQFSNEKSFQFQFVSFKTLKNITKSQTHLPLCLFYHWDPHGSTELPLRPIVIRCPGEHHKSIQRTTEKERGKSKSKWTNGILLN